MAEITDRINQFLYEFEQVDDGEINQHVTQIAADTGVAEEDVHKVLSAVLDILEGKKSARGIESGQAFPAYVVRHHTGRRRLWGGQ